MREFKQVKYESSTQQGLFFWAEPNEIDGGKTFCIVSHAEGFPASEAHDDWFLKLEDADEVAKKLASPRADFPAILEDVGRQVDTNCSDDANLQHIKNLLVGYRDYVLNKSEHSEFAPGSACDISWRAGRNMAELDLRGPSILQS